MVFEIKYTDDELIDILKDLAVELGRTPTMKDMMKRDGPPYPSLYQKRFSSGGLNQDGWNNALELTGLGFNRKKIADESTCSKCDVNALSTKGRLIRWKGTDEVLCMSCYQQRYYRMYKRTDVPVET